MEDYTLGLASFDYLPVLAGGLGLYLVCRYCAGQVDYRGLWVVLIPLIALTGGAFKATWKLIWALRGVNLQWMSDQLFFFLASAYLLMAVFVVRTLRAARNSERLAADWWLAPAAAAAVTVACAYYLKTSVDGRAWAALLLAVLSLANLALSLTLIGHAFARRDHVATAAFAMNLALSYVLVGLARMEQTSELQWIEQSLNLAANCLLAAGAWRLLGVSATGRPPR